MCVCAAHDSCSAAATAAKCLLHKALGQVVSRTPRAKHGLSSDSLATMWFSLCGELDWAVLTASHCSSHLFKADAIHFCFSVASAQMGRICIKVICLVCPKKGLGYVTLQLCCIWESSQIPNTVQAFWKTTWRTNECERVRIDYTKKKKKKMWNYHNCESAPRLRHASLTRSLSFPGGILCSVFKSVVVPTYLHTHTHPLKQHSLKFLKLHLNLAWQRLKKNDA